MNKHCSRVALVCLFLGAAIYGFIDIQRPLDTRSDIRYFSLYLSRMNLLDDRSVNMALSQIIPLGTDMAKAEAKLQHDGFVIIEKNLQSPDSPAPTLVALYTRKPSFMEAIGGGRDLYCTLNVYAKDNKVFHFSLSVDNGIIAESVLPPQPRRVGQ